MKYGIRTRHFIVTAGFGLAVLFPATVFADYLDSIDYPVRFCNRVLAVREPQNFSWAYYDGLVMDGMYRVWQRTGTTAYFDFFKQWLDRFASDTGLVNATGYRTSLDGMHNGFALCRMYELTNQIKYKNCAQQIYNVLPGYRRTTNGTPAHWNSSRELWLDGVWMLGNFLRNFGRTIGQKSFVDSLTAVHSVSVHASCYDPIGKLPFHAWDEDGVRSWANAQTRQSSQKWCRAIGWYVMNLADMLETIPPNHPQRAVLKDITTTYLSTLVALQDSTTGLWFQVIDKPHADSNWVEQSSACMFAYAMAKGIENGYLDAHDFQECVLKAYQGFMSNVLFNATSGHPEIFGTCVGTGVGSYSYYINRSQPTNDAHGSGAWLIAAEYLRTRYPLTRQRIYQAETAAFEGVVEKEHRGFTGSGFVNATNAVGAAITWNVNLDKAMHAQLTLRYANGSGNDRPVRVVVNGVTIEANLSCPAGKWNRWDSRIVATDLRKGTNTILVEALTAGGCPNIDLLAVDVFEATSSLKTMIAPVPGILNETRLITSGRFTVPAWAVGTASLTVYDLSGRIVYQGVVGDASFNFSALHKSRKTYLVHFSRLAPDVQIRQ